MAKSKSSPFKIAVIITIVIFALLVALVVLTNMSSESKGSTSFDNQPSIEGQPTLGQRDAPVTVVEFGILNAHLVKPGEK